MDKVTSANKQDWQIHSWLADTLFWKNMQKNLIQYTRHLKSVVVNMPLMAKALLELFCY